MIVGFVFKKNNYLNKGITTQNTFDLVVHDTGQHDIATLEIHLMQGGEVHNKQVKDELGSSSVGCEPTKLWGVEDYQDGQQ